MSALDQAMELLAKGNDKNLPYSLDLLPQSEMNPMWEMIFHA